METNLNSGSPMNKQTEVKDVLVNPIVEALKENYPHRPTKNGEVFQDSDGLYAANGEFIASFNNGNGDNFRMATQSVREFIVQSINSNISHASDQKKIKALVEAAKELLANLADSEGDTNEETGEIYPDIAKLDEAIQQAGE